MKSRIFTIGFSVILTAFTLYMVLDTFVISSVYQTDATQMNTSMFSVSAEASVTIDAKDDDEPLETSVGEPEASASIEMSTTSQTSAHSRGRSTGDSDGSSSGQDSAAASQSVFADASIAEPLTYEDAHTTITISEYVENDTHIYVADIQVDSAEYLKTAFANDSYGKNITAATSSIASDHDAILAINGDFYGSQEQGYVIRNGIIYRESSNGEDILCIYADGSMQIVNSSEYTAQELVDQGVWQALCFGPGLLEDGEILVSEGEEVGKAKASNPRTAIGMIDENHFVFVVSDGRTDESEGLSLYELAQFMQGLGVTCAYNLDGGGSSTMVFQGELVNNPTSGRSISERSVSDIVYIG